MLDVDGVLVFPNRGKGTSQFSTLKHDMGIDPDVLQHRFFKPFWRDIVTGREQLFDRLSFVLKTIAPTTDPEALIQYWFERESAIDNEMLSTVGSLRRRGIRVFLATNQEHRRAEYLMQDMRLSNHVDGMLYSAEIGHRKPSHIFFRDAGRKAGFDPDQVVFIDDTLDNVKAARAFGWQAVHWQDDRTLADVLSEFKL
ncbi:MAG: HAD-IA family hydrolase [Stappiaceae bacterium]